MTVTVATLANRISTLVNNTNQTTPSNVSCNNLGNFQGDLYAKLWEFEERRRRRESLPTLFKLPQFTLLGSGTNSNAKFSQFFAKVSDVLVGSNVVPDEVVCINTESKLTMVQ